MKYTEIIGELKTIYEGTAEEIMDLYSRMNSINKPKLKVDGNFIPKGYNTCRSINAVQNPDLVPTAPYVCHNAVVDKVADKISENLCKKAILGV